MKYITIVFLVLVTFSQSVNANLLVSPTRLSFEGRDRVKELILINVTDRTRSYRIEWEQNTVDNYGNYKTISDGDVRFASSNYIRYSPRQVTLQPGERQVVKLMLRRKADMDLPEYRSHLKMTALPILKDESQGEVAEGIGFKIDIMTSYTIPVIIRTTPISAKTSIEGVKVRVSNSGEAKFEINIAKTGATSVSGEIEVAFLDGDTGAESIVGILRGVNIFHEANSRILSVQWQNFGEPKYGKFRFTYTGNNEQAGQLLAESVREIKPSDFIYE